MLPFRYLTRDLNPLHPGQIYNADGPAELLPSAFAFFGFPWLPPSSRLTPARAGLSRRAPLLLHLIFWVRKDAHGHSWGAAGGKTALLGWLELLKHTEIHLLFVPPMPGHRLQQRQREDEGAQVGLLSPLLLLLLVSSCFSSPWGWPGTFCALPFPKSENLSLSGPEELGSLGYLGQERGLARVISQQDLAPALQS